MRIQGPTAEIPAGGDDAGPAVSIMARANAINACQAIPSRSTIDGEVNRYCRAAKIAADESTAASSTSRFAGLKATSTSAGCATARANWTAGKITAVASATRPMRAAALSTTAGGRPRLRSSSGAIVTR